MEINGRTVYRLRAVLVGMAVSLVSRGTGFGADLVITDKIGVIAGRDASQRTVAIRPTDEAGESADYGRWEFFSENELCVLARIDLGGAEYVAPDRGPQPGHRFIDLGG